MRRALSTMLLAARCGRAPIMPAAAAARRGRALSAAPTSFPLSSSKTVNLWSPRHRRDTSGVHHSHCLICAQDYAGDLLLLPFWSDKDIDVGAATIAQGLGRGLRRRAHGARGVAGVQGQEGRVPRLDRARAVTRCPEK